MIMQFRLIYQLIKIILFISIIIGCSTTDPNDLDWDYKEYMNSDYENTPDWQKTDAILSDLNKPEKIALWMSENFKFYDMGIRRRNYARLDDMQLLTEAVPPPSRFVNTGGANCFSAANFARIALEKAGYDPILLRLHNGDIKAANKSIGTGNVQVHVVCLVQYKNALFSVGDTYGNLPARFIWSGKIQGPHRSIDDFVNNYVGKFKHSQWKIITSQVSTFGHVPEKEECRGVSCE